MKRALIAPAAAVTLLFVGLPVLGGFMLLMLPGQALQAGVAGVSRFAHDTIPAAALQDYIDAARTCPGLSWTVLAGIGAEESDHGRSKLPGVSSGQNSAGAKGPMQFLQATWNAFHLPGMDDIYNHRDAVFAAAHYLCSNGAADAEKLWHALWLYNNANWYVADVLSWASQYAADPTQTTVVASVTPSTGDPFAGACHPVVTQVFGPVDNTLEPAVFGFAHFHTGIDLACAAGTPIHALTDGVAHVTGGCAAGVFICGSGWGNSVVVEVQLQLAGEAAPTHYFIRYAHLLVPTVVDGQAVHSGDLIGLEGTTGNSTGPHLHFEVDRGALGLTHAVAPTFMLTLAA
jgi:murein DD-endopeptidase MepM/ murein hydrolase activator NlpD